MSTLVAMLVANPRVEEKLVAEIARVVGDGEVEPRHLQDLEYLDWCMKETMRILPPAASYQRMAFDEDMLLGGKWRLNRWDPVVVDIFALHLDPETWGPD